MNRGGNLGRGAFQGMVDWSPPNPQRGLTADKRDLKLAMCLVREIQHTKAPKEKHGRKARSERRIGAD